jgi:hypothetical protein
MFENSYKPILNRIQEQDESQINFVKFNLEKLSRYIESIGKEMRKSGEDIMTTVGMSSSDTDLRIFIDTNKSTVPFVQRESYQEYEVGSSTRGTSKRMGSLNQSEGFSGYASNASSGGRKTSSLVHSQIETSIIDEDYIQQLTTVSPLKSRSTLVPGGSDV